MPLTIKDLRGNVNRRRPSWGRGALGAIVLAACILGTWAVWPRDSAEPEAPVASEITATPLSAAPSEDLARQLSALPDFEGELSPEDDFVAARFEDHIVHQIQTHGHLTITLHVALADQRLSRAPKAFLDGNDPSKNLYWGALFGVDTFFPNAGGWERMGAAVSRDPRILAQSLFHRRATPTSQWQARGISEPFDVYVLANAWASSDMLEAMRQPLRDALTNTTTTLKVDGQSLSFGSGSVLTGYLGLNSLLDDYVNPFEGLPDQRPTDRSQMGLFYICPQSAVVLHADIVAHDLYSALFTRDTIVPEAYIANGLFHALIEGDIDDGLIEGAAEGYTAYQKSVSIERAREIFYR